MRQNRTSAVPCGGPFGAGLTRADLLVSMILKYYAQRSGWR